MPTTITETIGTSSRDFSTIGAWEAALPADLVSADQVRIGSCYNDSEFTGVFDTDALVTIEGHTTDGTRYIELTAATGQSFQDNVNVRTNALKYNQSNGVGVRTTGGYSRCVMARNQNYVHLTRLQLYTDATNAEEPVWGGEASLFKDLIAQTRSTNTSGGTVFRAYRSNAIVNVLVIALGGVLGGFDDAGDVGFESAYIGCAAIRASDVTAAGNGFQSNYGSGHTLKSCVVFGFSTADSNGQAAGSSNNATDLASGLPGSNNQHSVSYSQFTPFTDADKDSLDLRAITSTSLDGNGLLDGTNAPNDISSYTRPASPTIGVWQLTVAAPVRYNLT